MLVSSEKKPVETESTVVDTQILSEITIKVTACRLVLANRNR